MKRLLLVRHGKSSWESPINDKDRPLINRGILDAHLVSAAIQIDLPQKYVIWSSSAKRTSETAAIFAQNISYPIENVVFKDDLYTFNSAELQKVIKTCNDNVDCLMLFGHNNAISDFVNKFGTIFIENVPTAGLVLIEFDCNSWENIKNGVTKKVIFPKDIR